MYSDEIKLSSLAKFINGYDYVIMDTSSLMEDDFCYFMDNVEKAQEYLSKDSHILIYQACLEELDKHANSSEKEADSKRVNALRAKKILKRERGKLKKILEFPKKGAGANFADNLIYVSVSELRINYRVLVITQDKNLAQDLNRLNGLESQYGRKVSTYKIVKDGWLEENRGAKYDNKPKAKPIVSKVEKPFLKTAKKKDVSAKTNDLLAEILAQDKRINSNFGNANYPIEKKKTDAKNQLQLFKKVPADSLKQAKLFYDATKLSAIVSSAASTDKPNTVQAKLADKAAPKVPAKPMPKTDSNKDKGKPTEPLYFGEGSSVKTALNQLSSKAGFMFRDPSIPFIKNVHGPIDLVIEDRDLLGKKLGSGKGEFEHKGYVFKVSKKGEIYRIETNPKPLEKPKEPEKKSKEAIPKAVKADSKSKAAEKPKEETKKSKDKPIKAKTKEPIAAPSKSEKKTATDKQKKEENTPTKASVTKKPVKKEPSKLDEAKKAERRLQSVLSNETYPKESKIADIKNQITLLKKLSPEEVAELKYNTAALKVMITLLG